MTEADHKTVLTQRTLLPISLVAAICAGVIWINSTLIAIDFKLQAIELELEKEFTKTEMENWALRFKMMNPEIEIPKVIEN
tara:strand:+ start:1772 stop:2014 length:243 start_codon:yes stop_codon:yes gene_type:complete